MLKDQLFKTSGLQFDNRRFLWPLNSISSLKLTRGYFLGLLGYDWNVLGYFLKQARDDLSTGEQTTNFLENKRKRLIIPNKNREKFKKAY